MDITIQLPEKDDLDLMNIAELRYELRRLILAVTKAPVCAMKRKDLIKLIQMWRCIPQIEKMIPNDTPNDEYTEQKIEDTTILVPTIKKTP